MAERSDWIKSNLLGATQNVLSNEQFQLIDGNNTEENPGINTNNRLIWGQVFLWPEAKYLGHPRYVLWDDHQIFETKSDYDEFRKAFKDFYKVWKSTVYNLDFTS